MTSFTQVKVILDRLVRGEEIRMHGAFWRGKTRDEFVVLKPMDFRSLPSATRRIRT